FTAAWEAATDLGAYLRGEVPDLAPEAREILRALGAGLTDEAAARRLGTSLRTYRHVGQRELPGQVRLLTGWGAWTDSDMEDGPVDELLDVAVERPALDQLEVEVGRTSEDRVHSGLTGDHREERHLDAVDQAGGHQRPVHRQAAVRAQR